MLNDMLGKYNRNLAIFRICLLLLWGIMFVLNKYTYFAADDYSYMNSFADSERIRSVFDIFPSMYAHMFSMNGRLVAHFFVRLFLMLPPWIFDIVNASMFLFLIMGVYRYCF